MKREEMRRNKNKRNEMRREENEERLDTDDWTIKSNWYVLK